MTPEDFIAQFPIYKPFTNVYDRSARNLVGYNKTTVGIWTDGELYTAPAWIDHMKPVVNRMLALGVENVQLKHDENGRREFWANGSFLLSAPKREPITCINGGSHAVLKREIKRYVGRCRVCYVVLETGLSAVLVGCKEADAALWHIFMGVDGAPQVHRYDFVDLGYEQVKRLVSNVVEFNVRSMVFFGGRDVNMVCFDGFTVCHVPDSLTMLGRVAGNELGLVEGGI
jgi:hypothetical protein